MSERLTSKNYWTEYYKDSSEDNSAIRRICGAYDRFWHIFIESAKLPPKTLVEIGAFPGRYLAYLGSQFNLKVTGIDFNPDREKVVRTLGSFGIHDVEYVVADFLQYQPTEKFDLVFSNGFIEHFINYNQVLDKHVDLLEKGGSLMVFIPNKRYLRSIYGNLVDRKNQEAHNLKCMDMKVFETFARRNELKITYLDYHGGFPYRVHAPLNFVQKLIYHPVRFLSIRLNKILTKYPNKYWSGTIVAIFNKP